MRVAIRPAEDGDLPAILAIYNDAVAHTTAVYDYAPRSLAAQREWFAAKQAAGWPVIVAETGGGAIGFASYGPFRPWPAYLHTVENSIYVAPGARGRGIGGALLERLIAAAREQPIHAMVAGIDAANEPSLRLHARFGFERVGHFRQVGWKFERWLDLVFLERLF
jgi:L-amino acid N-acyltransferase YncA